MYDTAGIIHLLMDRMSLKDIEKRSLTNPRFESRIG
jgi:hypothetical protein